MGLPQNDRAIALPTRLKNPAVAVPACCDVRPIATPAPAAAVHGAFGSSGRRERSVGAADEPGTTARPADGAGIGIRTSVPTGDDASEATASDAIAGAVVCSPGAGPSTDARSGVLETALTTPAPSERRSAGRERGDGATEAGAGCTPVLDGIGRGDATVRVGGATAGVDDISGSAGNVTTRT